MNKSAKKITVWVLSAEKPTKKHGFDHEACFEKYGYIDWRDNGVGYNVDDIVYIYRKRNGNEEGRILYKTIVNKSKIETSSPTGDEFWRGKNEAENYKGTYVRLKLVSKCNENDLPYSYLNNKYGFNAPQGKGNRLKEEIALYIDGFFNMNTKSNSKHTIGSEEKLFNYPKNMILYGPPGTGKTTVISTIINELFDWNIKKKYSK